MDEAETPATTKTKRFFSRQSKSHETGSCHWQLAGSACFASERRRVPDKPPVALQDEFHVIAYPAAVPNFALTHRVKSRNVKIGNPAAPSSSWMVALYFTFCSPSPAERLYCGSRRRLLNCPLLPRRQRLHQPLRRRLYCDIRSFAQHMAHELENIDPALVQTDNRRQNSHHPLRAAS